MSTFKISDVRAVGRAATTMQKTASVVLKEAVRAQTTTKTYDIFLSHAFSDAELILGVKVKLEGYGYSVYVDWLEDPQLDRSAVNPGTAETLRKRMACCRSLFYSTTEASSNSKWMPWECGYVDGKRGRSAILPLTDTGTAAFKGQEYLGIYPYIMEAPQKGETAKRLWVHHSPEVYCTFAAWMQGNEPCKH
jgi:hypothetical protein